MRKSCNGIHRLRLALPLLVALEGLLMLQVLPSVSTLSACAMSALIAAEGYTLDQIHAFGSPANYGDYNDPWDYFAFVMANSTPYLNSDGYGVVAYRDNSPRLGSRVMWHKRVTDLEDFNHTYYTGQYLQQPDPQAIWPHDVLDNALLSVRSGEHDPAIVLCHARNASAFTLGNHPFWFDHNGRTYTFMHNGYANSARAFMINRINQMHPGENWFEQHPSNYFGDPDPLQWVDTEVLFRYIMCYVISSGNDVLAGLSGALARIRPYILNSSTGVFNFIMSDGEKLYVFRSTPLTGPGSQYRLSYKVFRDQFCAVRTQVPGTGDAELNPRELVVFSRNAKPERYPDFTSFPLHSQVTTQYPPSSRPIFGEAESILIATPNPFSAYTSIRLQVPAAGAVAIRIYNLKGELVWGEGQEFTAPGTARFTWRGNDARGRPVSPGVYLIRANVGNEIRTARIVRIE